MFVNIKAPNQPKQKDLPKPILVQGFDQSDYSSFRKDLQEWLNIDVGIVPISIDSYGGRVDGLVSVIELVNKLRRDGYTIVTSVNAYAMSAGMLFSGLVGTIGYRFGSPNARFMMHEFSGIKSGKVRDLEISTEETTRFNKYWFEKLGERCKNDKNFFVKLIEEKHHADYYFDADEAKKLNVIDKIGIPSVNISYKMKVKIR